MRLLSDVEIGMNEKEKLTSVLSSETPLFIVFCSLMTHLAQTHFDVWMRLSWSVKAVGK